MNTSTYPEIVALTGIPLRQTINESDLALWRAALEAPASHAAIVVAFDGDEVDRAVKAHPEGLTAAGRFTARNQPSATVYIIYGGIPPHDPSGFQHSESGCRSSKPGYGLSNSRCRQSHPVI